MSSTGTRKIPRPTEAIDFLRRKVRVPTDAWDDLQWGEHAHAFTVAHSTEADVLNEIQGFLVKALEKGDAFGTVKKEMLALMEAKGWYGGNGHTKDDKDYINWRIRIIYDTNMKTAYSAAHYRKQLGGAALRPIWVYESKLVGDNRHPDHIALHGKAFRHDDPFWDTYYPPNGWGCQCSVNTKSEAGAERDDVDILESGDGGNPPPMTDKDGNPVNWEKFVDPTWKYNAGQEALAPNFAKYRNLAETRMPDDKTALSHVVERYRKDMDNTRMNQGQFKTLLERMTKKDYTPQDIMYQVGNLDQGRHDAMMKTGVTDSKIMATDRDLYHGTGDKNEAQQVPDRLFDALYETLQTPEAIYENTDPKYKRDGREIVFVTDTKDGKVLKVVLKQKIANLALRIKTIGWMTEVFTDAKYKKIW